jgi:hypothetical protein
MIMKTNNTLEVKVDLNDYSLVYCSSIANQIFRGLLESHPNRYNSVYSSDLGLIIDQLQTIKSALENGQVFTSENCKTISA